MVSFKGAAAGAAIGWFVTRQLDQADNGGEENQEPTSSNTTPGGQNIPEGMKTPDELAALYELEARNRPTRDSVEGWVGTTINDLSPGATATIKIRPTKGHHVQVERLEFTREDNHDYDIRIAGSTVSNSHKYVANPPRKVTHGKPIVCKVTNNTGSRTPDIDFEGEMWGWATDSGRGQYGGR